MIRITDFTFTYGQAAKPALKGINLKIKEGDFVLLTGSSGSGKSTLLKCLNGLVPHFYGGIYQGDVIVDGIPVKSSTVAQMGAHIGLVFQDSTSQLVTETVYDEIAFGPANLGLSEDEVTRRVGETITATGIKSLAKRDIATLSGGERQKVAVASVVAMRPRVVALDEPTAELDPESAEELLSLLERLNRDYGLTIVLAEHRLERVIGHANMIINIEDGRASAGPVRDMLPRIDTKPPIVEVGELLGWKPLPVTVVEARKQAKDVHLAKPCSEPGKNRGRIVASLRDVSLSYGGKAALDGVSLDIRAGEVLAVLGRNGAGKTTLLKTICGLLKPDTGKAFIESLDTTQAPRQAVFRKAGYVPQRPGVMLFAETVKEEIESTSREIRTENLCETMGLAGHENDYPRDLSLGEQQRVALAAVLVKQPALLLLDEPTHGLDYKAKKVLAEIFKKLIGQGKAVVLVTHDIETAALAAGRVIILNEGRISKDGEARDILSSEPAVATQINKIFGGKYLTVNDIKEAARL